MRGMLDIRLKKTDIFVELLSRKYRKIRFNINNSQYFLYKRYN